MNWRPSRGTVVLAALVAAAWLAAGTAFVLLPARVAGAERQRQYISDAVPACPPASPFSGGPP